MTGIIEALLSGVDFEKQTPEHICQNCCYYEVAGEWRNCDNADVNSYLPEQAGFAPPPDFGCTLWEGKG
jgi:hypothetical protein